MQAYIVCRWLCRFIGISKSIGRKAGLRLSLSLCLCLGFGLCLKLLPPLGQATPRTASDHFFGYAFFLALWLFGSTAPTSSDLGKASSQKHGARKGITTNFR